MFICCLSNCSISAVHSKLDQSPQVSSNPIFLMKVPFQKRNKTNQDAEDDEQQIWWDCSYYCHLWRRRINFPPVSHCRVPSHHGLQQSCLFGWNLPTVSAGLNLSSPSQLIMIWIFTSDSWIHTHCPLRHLHLLHSLLLLSLQLCLLCRRPRVTFVKFLF